MHNKNIKIIKIKLSELNSSVTTKIPTMFYKNLLVVFKAMGLSNHFLQCIQCFQI